MSLSITCTNPDCGKTMPYAQGDFQVVCPHCNTWHLAPEPGTTAPSMPELDEEVELYVPEPDAIVDLPPDDGPPEMATDDAPAPLNGESSENVLAKLFSDTGATFTLKVGKNIIGRKGTDIVLDDKTVSRRHCVIEAEKSETGGMDYFLCDIGHESDSSSTNGVYISGRSQRLQDYERVPLSVGTTVRIGRVSLRLKR